MYTESATYLGVSFNEPFSDNKDIACQMRLLYARANMFLRVFAQSSINVKCNLLQKYFVVLDGPFLWIHFRKQSVNNLRISF